MPNLENIFERYRHYIDFLANSNQKNFTRFIKWLLSYIRLKTNERSFHSTYLPKYQEGQIIFADFGCCIGSEFSYPHYAVVLNVSDRKKNQLLTVVPLTSKKKPKHTVLKPWEHELSMSIPKLLMVKVIQSFDLYKPEYEELRSDIIRLSLQQLSESEFNSRYSDLLNQGIDALIKNNKDIMELREKMKEGSIVETNQIKTISKSRIISPTKQVHPLYNVKISSNDLHAIKYKIMKNIIIGDIDTKKEQRV